VAAARLSAGVKGFLCQIEIPENSQNLEKS
jgi:hypothetical protein